MTGTAAEMPRRARRNEVRIPLMSSTALSATLALLLWRADLGEQGVCLVSPDLVLVPRGTRLVALGVEDGKVVWEHVFEEARGPLPVPCRIQGVQLLPGPVPRLPGLLPRAPSPRRDLPPPTTVCLAGQSEVRCLSLRGGTVLWKAAKEDCCILGLDRVGDVDGDGSEDLVSSGCNSADCFSGRTGAVLWREPIGGRSLWAGPCGDLDGDGLGEVLLQAGTDLRVLSPSGQGKARTVFRVSGFYPRAVLPEDRSFLVALAGASAWTYGPDGKGEKVWDSKARLLSTARVGAHEVLVAREGVWLRSVGRPFEEVARDEILAAAAASSAIFFANGRNELLRLRPGEAPCKLADLPGPAEAISVDGDGRLLAIVVGRDVYLYRLSERGP